MTTASSVGQPSMLKLDYITKYCPGLSNLRKGDQSVQMKWNGLVLNVKYCEYKAC